MEINKVVAHFKEGTLIKGSTNDFSPNKKLFHLKTLNNETINVDIEQLKAIYFVKDFGGNKNHKDTYNDVISGGGKKIQVFFNDGEIVIGYSQGYFSPDRLGFFITPADTQSNSERIFVVKSATKEVAIL